MNEQALTSTAYIQHHLHHLQLNLHTWTIGPSHDFWVLNLDTLIVSILLGAGFVWLFSIIAKHAIAGVPSRGQNMANNAVFAV